jgi:hypothetical protein
MNDPHVAALLYRIEHSPMYSYEDTLPYEHDLPEFRIRIEGAQATVEPKEHFATAEEARAVVEPVLNAWELDAGLEINPGVLHFAYLRPEIVDRTSGVPYIPTGVVAVTGFPVIICLPLREYPAPPVGLVVSPEADAMYDRFTRYKAGQVPLGPMADFCLTVLEKGGQRSAAAKKYGIDPLVLSTLGDLAAEKGGRIHSRKWKGWSSEYSQQERAWIEAAVKRLIRRAAEVAYDPKTNRPLITMGDLPPL